MPVSVEEKIPWQCRRLIIGTGTGALPLMDDVKREAKRREIELLVLPTTEAIEAAFDPTIGREIRKNVVRANLQNDIAPVALLPIPTHR